MTEGIVVPYDPEWPRLFEAERARLQKVLAPWLERGIHHIGSTSVPGLAAKPIIDMIAGVRDLEEARAAFEPLCSLGYEYREHRPEAHCFWKPEPDVPLGPTHHLHLTEPESDIWRERSRFAMRYAPNRRSLPNTNNGSCVTRRRTRTPPTNGHSSPACSQTLESTSSQTPSA